MIIKSYPEQLVIGPKFLDRQEWGRTNFFWQVSVMSKPSHNIFYFIYRIGMMLNVRYEKIDQLVVKETIKFCEDTWSGVKLIDYTVAQNNLITEESPGNFLTGTEE